MLALDFTMTDRQDPPAPNLQGRPRPGLGWVGAWVCLVLGGGTLGVLSVLQSDPDLTEALYCGGIFPVVRIVLAPVGLVPFSVAELMLLLLGGVACVGLVRAVRKPKGVRRLIGWTVVLAAAILFIFEVSWGFNHARRPFAWHAGWDVRPRPNSELAELVLSLGEEAALERGLCLQDGPGSPDWSLQLGGGPDGDPRLHEAWLKAARVHPVLGGRPLAVRRPVFSGLMSALGISGIYSPFTAEAHVNAQVPLTQVPFVTAHEVAHGRGFAREDEANFIAYLVCRFSDDPGFRYSGSLQALSHARGALGRADRGLLKEASASLDPGVLADLQRQYRFWRSKKTALWEWSSRANDVYLKSQGQAAGIRSYGRMVDLLLAKRLANKP